MPTITTCCYHAAYFESLFNETVKHTLDNHTNKSDENIDNDAIRIKREVPFSVRLDPPHSAKCSNFLTDVHATRQWHWSKGSLLLVVSNFFRTACHSFLTILLDNTFMITPWESDPHGRSVRLLVHDETGTR